MVLGLPTAPLPGTGWASASAGRCHSPLGSGVTRPPPPPPPSSPAPT